MPYSGDGGDPLFANFSGVTGVTLGSKGQVYIADGTNHRVRCIGCSSPSSVFDPACINTKLLSVNPNPSHGKFALGFQFSHISCEVSLFIYDLTGRVVKQMVTNERDSLMFDLHVPTGIYFIKASIDHQYYFQKVVIE